MYLMHEWDLAFMLEPLRLNGKLLGVVVARTAGGELLGVRLREGQVDEMVELHPSLEDLLEGEHARKESIDPALAPHLDDE